MKTIHYQDGKLTYDQHSFQCAVGVGGVVTDKREGDNATPIGRFPIREVWYRADRITTLQTDLPTRAIAPSDGWCDEPGDSHYNQHITRPYPASSEALWRDDEIYDLIVVMGYNDDPVVPGKGSAVFLHVARPGYPPTAGCLALSRADLLLLLAAVPAAVQIDIQS